MSKNDVLYRLEAIEELCANKKVLNLGYLQHADWKKKVDSDLWLHGRIEKVATQLTGLDYLADEVEEYNRLYGTQNKAADVTKLDDLDLDEIFDVIVCGELIEHIDNPGLMLSGLKRFMNKDTLLVITTPNPWAARWVKMAHQGYEGSRFLNSEHVCWYSFHTLRQLLERHGYSEKDYGFYYAHSSVRTKYQPLREHIKALLAFFMKNVYASPAFPKFKQAGLFFVSKVA